MKEMSNQELLDVNGGGRETYMLIWSGAAGAVTGGNWVAVGLAGYAAGKHYDWSAKQYKGYKFNPATYKHPWRDLR